MNFQNNVNNQQYLCKIEFSIWMYNLKEELKIDYTDRYTFIFNNR